MLAARLCLVTAGAPLLSGFGRRPRPQRPKVPPMLIRATKTGTAKDGSARLSHRLVENQRSDGKVRQSTLLNLGRHFTIERAFWPLMRETPRSRAIERSDSPAPRCLLRIFAIVSTTPTLCAEQGGLGSYHFGSIR